MQIVSLSEAQRNLPELIRSLSPGEELSITDRDVPVARLVRLGAPPSQRALGTMQGTVRYMAADFDAPLEDFKDYME